MELLDRNRQLIEAFRADKSKVDGKFNGQELLLLTTIGVKSGQPRTSPVAYTADGDQWVIMASNAGQETHPNWYRNLLANPKVTVEVGDESFEATATTAPEGAERARLWAKVVADKPGFAEYQAKMQRQIPVVVLTRRK